MVLNSLFCADVPLIKQL